MVMLTAALDCSSPKSKQSFVMAGFVSSAERWVEFDGEWMKRLTQDGLTHFHMHSFTQCIHGPAGPFDETWKGQEKRRKALLADLLGMIQSHAWYKVAAIIQVNSMRLFSDEARREFVPTLIATGGRLCWAEIEIWRKREKYKQQARMVFEDGDTEKGSLIEALKHVTGRTPSFEPKKDFTPLQAADILAYEAQKLTQRYDHPLKDVQLRFPYVELERVPGDIGNLRDDGVKLHDEMMRVMQYFDKNPLPKPTVQ